MYRQALRSTPRAAGALRQSLSRSAPRRFASTSPADKPRSWKSSALRWGLAGAAVYYYATSTTFAEEQSARTIPEPPHFSESDLKTVDAVIEEKRQKNIVKAKESAPEPVPAAATDAIAEPTLIPEGAPTDEPAPGSMEALEEEAGQQAAFNPETGEINWDCPCLGGMADGPCGEEFKAAFSCFVYSEEEPKGMDCIEKFQGMQECFRKYPEVYSAELADDEEAEAAAAPVPSEGSPTETGPAVNADGDAIAAPEKVVPRASTEEKVSEKPAETKTEEKKTEPTPAPVKPEAATESAPSEVPTEAFDATEANKKDE